jgi:SanA protein
MTTAHRPRKTVRSLVFARGARQRWIESPSQLPARLQPTLIVVLGCPPRTRDGRPSLYLAGRAEAAAAAFHALAGVAGAAQGGVRVLVSGRVRPPWPVAEHEAPEHDETAVLSRLLRASNVPGAALEIDREALRTLDSIDHLAVHYPRERILLVSQAFHLPRVLFLARARGLEAWGLPAPGPRPGPRNRLREVLGQLRALFDVAWAPPGR